MNAFFILIPVYYYIDEYFFYNPIPARMVHGISLEMLLGFLLLFSIIGSYPILLLFYIFGIKLLNHYFLESHKAQRFTFIAFYSIYTIFPDSIAYLFVV